MQTFKKKLLTAVTVMALSPLAQAGMISFDDSHTLSTTDWFDTLTVSQFDASLGTLNTIDISFSASMLSDLLLNNNDAASQRTSGNVSVQTYGTFLGLGNLEITLGATSGRQTLAADDGAAGGLDEYVASGLTGADMLSITIDSTNADFLSFIGTGDISTTNLEAVGGFGATGGGNIVAEANTTAGARLNVAYNFTDAPVASVSEPGSLAILALGLVGFGLRRKQKSL